MTTRACSCAREIDCRLCDLGLHPTGPRVVRLPVQVDEAARTRWCWREPPHMAVDAKKLPGPWCTAMWGARALSGCSLVWPRRQYLVAGIAEVEVERAAAVEHLHVQQVQPPPRATSLAVRPAERRSGCLLSRSTV